MELTFDTDAFRLDDPMEALVGPRNVGSNERVASALGGGVLLLYGLTRGSLGGLALALTGGILAYRGLTGHCPGYAALGVSTATEEKRAPVPVQIEESVTVKQTPESLYAVWRDVERLPEFMRHLVSVRHLTETRSHWIMQLPEEYGRIDWEAEVIADHPGERIIWRSLPGSDVQNAGVVSFHRLGEEEGTELRVSFTYQLPGAAIGRAAAKLIGPTLADMVHEDLLRFKQAVELGDLPLSPLGDGAVTTDSDPDA